MKKIFIIIFLLIAFSLTGCDSSNSYNKSSEAKTLTKFVENHDSKHLGCAGEGCGDMGFVAKSFKCDLIKDKTIIFMDRNNIITSDYKIYDITLGDEKIYSNNQQCIEKNMDIKIDGVYTYRYTTLLKSNDKLYEWGYNEGDSGKKITLFMDLSGNASSYSSIMKEGYNFIYQNYDKCEHIVAIKDGDIYKLESCNDPGLIDNKTVIYSQDDYGYIKNAKYSSELYRYKNSYLDIEPQITKMITDNGIYVLRERLTDECQKYEDIKCDLKLELSDVYSKYKNDIKYLGIDYAILNDNNVISTDIFYANLNQ